MNRLDSQVRVMHFEFLVPWAGLRDLEVCVDEISDTFFHRLGDLLFLQHCISKISAHFRLKSSALNPAEEANVGHGRHHDHKKPVHDE